MKPCNYTHTKEQIPVQSAFGDYLADVEHLNIETSFGKISLSKVSSWGKEGWWSINFSATKTLDVCLIFKPTVSAEDVLAHFNKLHNDWLEKWL